MISACLLGVCCRYDGEHSRSDKVVDFAASVSFIPFCPEQLGGLPTPRPPANMVGGDGPDILAGRGRLINEQGEDVTRAFLKGAREALKLARLTGALAAVTKDKSPSCGLHTPYCDKPSGMGVTAALFASQGIRVFEMGRDDPFPNDAFWGFLNKLMPKE